MHVECSGQNKKMEMDLISVIIPVFNVEEYISECLDSLINQTYPNLEIILVDDGSSDRSGEICDVYAEKYKHIQVIHQNNSGQSIARNNALDIAKGQYIMFVDSDDRVHPDFCRIPYEIAREHDVEIVIFRYKVFGGGAELPEAQTCPGPMSQEEAMSFIYQNITAYPVNKLYRRDLFREIRFIPGHVYEDVVFTPEIIHQAKRIWYTDAVLYEYRQRAGSTTKTQTTKNFNDYCFMHSIAAEKLASWGYHTEADVVRNKIYWEYRIKYGRNAPNADEYTEYIRRHPEITHRFRWRGKLLYRLLCISPVGFDIVIGLLNVARHFEGGVNGKLFSA